MSTRRSQRSQAARGESRALATPASTAAATTTTITVYATTMAPPQVREDGAPLVEHHKPRGRRRKLPTTSNSERSKYRRKHAQEREEVEDTTVALRRQVLYLEIRLEIHRQLQRCWTPLATQRRVLDHVMHFIEDKIHHKRHGLGDEAHELAAVQFMGCADAPIIRVRSMLRGRLTTPVIHSIYPFVLGNTVVLDKMMHQEVEYSCSYLFFFTADGHVERESVELDTVMAIRQPLLDLSTVARVLTEIDIEGHGHDTPRTPA